MSKPKNLIIVGTVGLGISTLLYPALLLPAILAPMYRLAGNASFPDPLWWLGDPAATLDTRAAIIQSAGVVIGLIAVICIALLITGLIRHGGQRGAAKAIRKA